MTIVGIDDTDSRETGMCSTYAAHRIADRIDRAGGTVRRVLLVRLNPAVEHKTRGNAALAVHADVDPDRAEAVAREVIEDGARVEDPETNPGLVVAPGDGGTDDPGESGSTDGRSSGPVEVPDAVAAFARQAVRDHHGIDNATELIDRVGYRSEAWGNGRGRIGALAAVGAWAAFGREDGDWTYERIAYRAAHRRGTPREVDRDSVFEAADRYYPAAWDTVDRVEGQAVCVPHTPGPILYGIRGDDPDVVERLAAEVDSEPVVAARTFLTNQGTDAHLRRGSVPDLEDGRAYRVPGVVVVPPETREGGHVFFEVADPPVVPAGDADLDGETPTHGDPETRTLADDDPAAPTPADLDPESVPDRRRLRCAAFEPTKRFRDRVRALRAGDRILACGELAEGTLKLEKFAVRDRRKYELATPDCPDCGRSMGSAGAGQGYRCRDCSTTAPGKVPRPVDRDLEVGWYEVPPCARRHVAKPLVRGGFDAPVHPER